MAYVSYRMRVNGFRKIERLKYSVNSHPGNLEKAIRNFKKVNVDTYSLGTSSSTVIVKNESNKSIG